MGASGWEYYVVYQEDLEAALGQLRDRVFAEGDYWWSPTRGARPGTMDELWQDEGVQESGTHSILDMFGVLGPADTPQLGAVQLVSAAEARDFAGVERLTRAHVEAIQPLARERWLGRCAVLHDEAGRPEEIYFWGFSGD